MKQDNIFHKFQPLAIIVPVVLAAVILVSGFFYHLHETNRENLSQNKTDGLPLPDLNPVSTPAETNTTVSSTPATNATPAPATTPSTSREKVLDVPFTSQAPLAVWDSLHEDACEEASLIMVKHYIDKTAFDSKTSADKEINDISNYESANGYGLSITEEELNKLALNYFGMKTGRIINNITIEKIKSEIDAGRPVIIPASGKALKNPNFKNGGPNYHNLVVKGYDRDGIITNDPGTRKGEGYRYNEDVFYSAIHNWNPDDINLGSKTGLVFD
ncbi:MAG: C39 family peptidase [Candidatus Berkelbacteria bacterium]|nr:C39 family peptidase [Candidatus Berkelbacteria bacterium]